MPCRSSIITNRSPRPGICKIPFSVSVSLYTFPVLCRQIIPGKCRINKRKCKIRVKKSRHFTFVFHALYWFCLRYDRKILIRRCFYALIVVCMIRYVSRPEQSCERITVSKIVAGVAFYPRNCRNFMRVPGSSTHGLKIFKEHTFKDENNSDDTCALRFFPFRGQDAGRPLRQACDSAHL